MLLPPLRFNTAASCEPASLGRSGRAAQGSAAIYVIHMTGSIGWSQHSGLQSFLACSAQSVLQENGQRRLLRLHCKGPA